jgi:hypothetical protein
MKFLDRLLKKLATVIEIILLGVVAVGGRSGNAEVVYRGFFRCRVLLNCFARQAAEAELPVSSRTVCPRDR